MEFLIISGLSGSGKSHAAAVLEDIGYYIVDNLPAEMLVKFAEFCASSGGRFDKVAMVYDVRAGEPFDELLQAIRSMKNAGLFCKLLFLDCDTRTLISRYKETRRSHPLLAEDRNTQQAIELERQMLQSVRDHADFVLDTSAYPTAKLRSMLLGMFGSKRDQYGLSVVVTSFGFKYGLPMEADLVFDARFLPNPYYVEELKLKTGLERDVSDFVLSYPQSSEFLRKLSDMLLYLLPMYKEEGKSVLVIGIGCTGGHHRSVVIAHELAATLRDKGYPVTESHRDVSR